MFSYVGCAYLELVNEGRSDGGRVCFLKTEPELFYFSFCCGFNVCVWGVLMFVFKVF